jgi:hypothetical protein
MKGPGRISSFEDIQSLSDRAESNLFLTKDVTQWQNTYLACARPWGQSPVPHTHTHTHTHTKQNYFYPSQLPMYK